MQESLFIAWGCLGFKSRKLGFFHRFSLINSKKTDFNLLPGVGCLGQKQNASPAHSQTADAVRLRQPLRCDFLCFLLVFDRSFSWKLIGTWNQFSSICIVFNNLLRTVDLQFFILNLHMMSWFDDLHDSSLQYTQNTYGVAWSWIKLNYNDSIENNTICS